MNYKNVSKFIEQHSIDDCARTFGVSNPTISRWKEKKEFPKSAEIVISLLNKIDDLSDSYEQVIREKNRIERTVDLFNNSLNELRLLS